MDQSEHQLQSLGICNKLFNFIMRNVAQHGFKTVTLGTPMVHPMPQAPPTSSSGHGHDEEQRELPAAAAATATPKAPPKKTVSINDRVEEIIDTYKAEKKPIKKMIMIKKKKKQTQKSNSLDLEQEQQEEELKPLKSILKVGSKVYEKSNSIA